MAVLDLGTMTWHTTVTPTSGTVLAIRGDTMLFRTPTVPLTVRRFAADGGFSDVVPGGIPGDTTVTVKKADADGAVLRLGDESAASLALLDFRTAGVTSVPGVTGDPNVLLDADHVAVYQCDDDVCPVRLFDRSDLAVGPRTITVPKRQTVTTGPDGTTTVTTGTQTLLLVGSHVIDGVPPKALDYSVSGAPTVVTAVQTDGNAFAQAAGSALVVGGAGDDWGVHRLTEAADGSLAQRTVLDLVGDASNAGLTFARGVLRHFEAVRVGGDDDPHYALFNHTLAAGGTAIPAAGGEVPAPIPCEAGKDCVRAVDSNSYGVSVLATVSGEPATVVAQRFGPAGSMGVVTTNATGLIDASPDYVITRTADGNQEIRQPWSGYNMFHSPARAAALWFSSVWTNPAAGTLSLHRQLGVSTSAPDPTFSTGATCVADELQATSRYVYWSCGADGPAGVLDTVGNRTVSLPGGRYLLGDGYVVRHDSATGSLLRYDLTGATLGDPVALATVATGGLTDDRNVTWAVDKYSGDLAYVDSADAVHIVDPRVPPSAPATTTTPDTRPYAYPKTAKTLYQSWPLTRPIDAWSFTATRVATGEVAATMTGGAARTSIANVWDGHLTSGAEAPQRRLPLRPDRDDRRHDQHRRLRHGRGAVRGGAVPRVHVQRHVQPDRHPDHRGREMDVAEPRTQHVPGRRRDAARLQRRGPVR